MLMALHKNKINNFNDAIKNMTGVSYYGNRRGVSEKFAECFSAYTFGNKNKSPCMREFSKLMDDMKLSEFKNCLME